MANTAVQWHDHAATTRALAGLGSAALAVLLMAAVWLGYDRTGRAGSDLAIVSFLVVGVATLSSGWLGWWRRPQSLVGVLLVVAGLLFLTWGLTVTPWSPTFTIGFLVGESYLNILALALLTFPTGRPANGLERVLVAAIVVLVLLGWMFPNMFVDTTTPLCDGCPPNLALIADAPDVVNFFSFLSSAIGVVVAAGFVVVQVRKWRGASAAARRALAPVLVTGVLLGMVVVADQVLELASVTSSEASIYWIELVFVLAASLGFLVGLLRTRMTRAAVGDLVVELGSAGLPAEGLREALARRLGDPSLEILYHVPTRGGYVDADGRRVELPQDDAGRIVTLLESDGTPIAALVHDEVLGHDPEILEAVSAAAQLAIANERLRAEVRSQLEEVRASRARIVQAGDAERRRVERDLHDGAQQRLVTLSLRLGLLRERVETVDGRDLTADLDSVAKELHEAIDELRELSRGIHPTVLTDEGLGAAVESLVDRSPIHVTIEALPVERWSAPIEATAYFVAAEALTNAAKHAPGAEVRLSVSRVGDNVRVVVVDDGPGGARLDGSGLRGLEDRVAAAGGSLSLESRPGEGTVVRAEIPCHGN